MFDLNMELIRKHIRLWLEEDIGTGDVTTLTTIPLEQASKGIIHVKEDGIVCGLRIAQEVFAVVDASLRFETKVVEGSSVYKGTILAEVEGNTRSILLGERLKS